MDNNFLYNFMLYAVVIVYKDGTIDSVPVAMKFRSYLEYFSFLKNNSSTFAELCKNCNFNDPNCGDIKERLYKNGSVLFFNSNIRNIITHTVYDLPVFQVIIPSFLDNPKQMEEIEEIIDNYSEQYLVFHTYEGNKIKDLSIEEVKEIIGSIHNVRKVA